MNSFQSSSDGISLADSLHFNLICCSHSSLQALGELSDQPLKRGFSAGREEEGLLEQRAAHLRCGLFQLGLFHQQFIRGAFVTLDLLFLNLLHQSFLFGFQKVQLLQWKGSRTSHSDLTRNTTYFFILAGSNTASFSPGDGTFTCLWWTSCLRILRE